MPPRKRVPQDHKEKQPPKSASATVTAIKPRNPNSFVASGEVDPLEYNFAPFVDVAGVIPEPSNAQIQHYRNTFNSIMEQATELAAESEKLDEIERAKLMIEVMGDETQNDIAERVIEATAHLCSNSPTAEQIRALPYRVQQAFTGWLVGTFLRPEV